MVILYFISNQKQWQVPRDVKRRILVNMYKGVALWLQKTADTPRYTRRDDLGRLLLLDVPVLQLWGGRLEKRITNLKKWFWQVKFFSETSQFIQIQKSGFQDLGIHFSRSSDPDQSVRLHKIFYSPEPYMGPIFCFWYILIQPLLLGAPLINVVLSSKVITEFWICMNWEGSEKNFNYKNHVWPHLLFLTNFDLALPSRGYSTDLS